MYNFSIKEKFCDLNRLTSKLVIFYKDLLVIGKKLVKIFFYKFIICCEFEAKNKKEI